MAIEFDDVDKEISLEDLIELIESHQLVHLVLVNKFGVILYAGKAYDRPLVVIEADNNQYRYVRKYQYTFGIRFRCIKCASIYSDAFAHRCLKLRL